MKHLIVKKLNNKYFTTDYVFEDIHSAKACCELLNGSDTDKYITYTVATINV